MHLLLAQMTQKQAGKPRGLWSTVVDVGELTHKMNSADRLHLESAEQQRTSNGAAEFQPNHLRRLHEGLTDTVGPSLSSPQEVVCGPRDRGNAKEYGGTEAIAKPTLRDRNGY